LRAGLQEINHLIVTQGRYGHLANLDQPGGLPQARLPRQSHTFDLRHNTVRLNVEAQLSEVVPLQRQLGGWRALSYGAQTSYNFH
jgi:hypothetical protein